MARRLMRRAFAEVSDRRMDESAMASVLRAARDIGSNHERSRVVDALRRADRSSV